MEVQRPELILVLGKEPSRFLSSLSPDLSFWKKNQSFAKLDEVDEQVKRKVKFNNEVECDLVLLTHPSFRPVNVHRRRYNGEEGHPAEIEMIKQLK